MQPTFVFFEFSLNVDSNSDCQLRLWIFILKLTYYIINTLTLSPTYFIPQNKDGNRCE